LLFKNNELHIISTDPDTGHIHSTLEKLQLLHSDFPDIHKRYSGYLIHGKTNGKMGENAYC